MEKVYIDKNLKGGKIVCDGLWVSIQSKTKNLTKESGGIQNEEIIVFYFDSSALSWYGY